MSIRVSGVSCTTKLEHLKTYYSVIRQLYEEVYQARPDKLLGDQKNLEAAYLFFPEEARRDLREKSKANDKKSDDAA